MLRLRQDIPLFPGGKKKAFTLSYDDGVTQDKRLIELMKRYGLRGTFNLNPGLFGKQDWLVQPGIDVSHYKFSREEVAEIYKGYEIAGHSMTHPNLVKVPESMTSYEVVQCRKELEEITGKPVRGMAYPGGDYSGRLIRLLRQCQVAYARTVVSTHDFRLPEDFLAWHPTCHHVEDCLEQLGEEFLKPISEENYCYPEVFYLWGHSYEFDAHKNWHRIEAFFEKMSGRDDIWYAENIEIVEYMEAVERLIYSASGDYIKNPSSQTVWMCIDKRTYQIEAGATITVLDQS